MSGFVLFWTLVALGFAAGITNGEQGGWALIFCAAMAGLSWNS